MSDDETTRRDLSVLSASMEKQTRSRPSHQRFVRCTQAESSNPHGQIEFIPIAPEGLESLMLVVAPQRLRYPRGVTIRSKSHNQKRSVHFWSCWDSDTFIVWMAVIHQDNEPIDALSITGTLRITTAHASTTRHTPRAWRKRRVVTFCPCWVIPCQIIGP